MALKPGVNIGTNVDGIKSILQTTENYFSKSYK
jgi:hypothetical protein